MADRTKVEEPAGPSLAPDAAGFRSEPIAEEIERSGAERKRRCLMVAPFHPGLANESMGLGASRKIAGVIDMFVRHDWTVTLLDSSHATTGFAGWTERAGTTSGGSPFRHLIPPSLPSRPLGKLCHLFLAPGAARRLAREGADAMWVYNGYAFEAVFLRFFVPATRARIILELEDWPLARRRGGGLHPKPWLDYWGMRLCLRRTHVATVVNADLQCRKELARVDCLLFPGLVDVTQHQDREPFAGDEVKIGYSGGLHVEKGVRLLLEAAPRLPAGFKFCLTGSGPLVDEVRAVADAWPAKLEFHGNVEVADLRRLQNGCDAFINPHRPTAEMGNGVFPFKVMEYLALGRPVISTALPQMKPDIRPALLVVSPTAGAILDAVGQLREFWQRQRMDIQHLADEIGRCYSADGMYRRLAARLGWPLS